MAKKILICGLTGAGKTTLARALKPLIGGVILDGDAVRDAVGAGPPTSAYERERHAERMGLLADLVTASGNNAICSFVAPTQLARRKFGADFTVWVDRAGDGKYPDTQAMFEEPPSHEYDLRVTNGHTPQYWAAQIAAHVQPMFSSLRNTALLVGRYQPFHDGHKALAVEALKKHGQICIGVRDQNREWPFERVKTLIDNAMIEHRGTYTVIPLPNITSIVYGRDVGYTIEQLHLSPDIEEISGTKLRRLQNGHS